MANTIGHFIRPNETPESLAGISTPILALHVLIDDGIQNNLDLVTVEEAEGGVLFIAPRRVAERIIDLMNSNPEIFDST